MNGDRLDRLLEGGEGNRDAVNTAILEDHQRWASLHQPCPHTQGHHWPGDAAGWLA